jgi:putative addiction module component (TIGR02574 family)
MDVESRQAKNEQSHFVPTGAVMTQLIDLSEIKALSIPQRILVVEEIWDSIAAEQDHVPLTSAQREELDRRLLASESDPTEGSSWEEVKSRIRPRE